MSDSVPLVSVVIPAYRVTEYIAENLTSVMNQTLRNFEAIVVNDCCPDTVALEKVLDPFREQIVYLKLEKNQGPSAARNKAIRAAKGEWIAFLDGDDIWEPNYLEVQTGMMKAHPEATIIYGDARIIGSIYDGKSSQSFSPANGPITIKGLLDETAHVPLLNVTRRDALVAAGLFDETLRQCEDFDLWCRILRFGGVVRYHSKIIAGYRRRPGSLTCDPVKMYHSRMQVLDKLGLDPLLEPAERAALERARLRWTAELNLDKSKLCFEEAKMAEAEGHLRSANLYFRKTRLYVIQFLMDHCPAVLRFGLRIRRIALGY